MRSLIKVSTGCLKNVLLDLNKTEKYPTYLEMNMNWPNPLKWENPFGVIDLTFYALDTPFDAFAKRVDRDQAALTLRRSRNFVRGTPGDSQKTAWATFVFVFFFYYVLLWKYDISDPTQVDLTSNFFVQYTNMKVYL